MRIRVHTKNRRGRGRTQRNIGPTSARHASPRHESFLPTHATSHPLVLATGYPGALLEGLRCYPLSARSRKRTRFVGKLSLKPRNSR